MRHEVAFHKVYRMLKENQHRGLTLAKNLDSEIHLDLRIIFTGPNGGATVNTQFFGSEMQSEVYNTVPVKPENHENSERSHRTASHGLPFGSENAVEIINAVPVKFSRNMPIYHLKRPQRSVDHRTGLEIFFGGPELPKNAKNAKRCTE